MWPPPALPRPAEVARHLRDDVAGCAKQQPGCVSGQWLGRDGGTVYEQLASA
jgi:hypothetical protein